MNINKQKGFSIIEVMVALLVATIMLAGVLKIFIHAKNSSLLESNFSEIQSNARFATTYLSRIIFLAGYRSPPVSGSFSSYTDVFPVSTTPFISGTNGTGANGSDTLTIRYQGSGNGTGTPDGSITDCLNNAVDAGTMVTNVFSITNDNELQCESTVGGSTTSAVLVSGVENMQVLFGEDVDGNGTVDRYVPSSFSGLDTDRIISVRVNLLFRSTDPVDLTPDSVTYNLNSQAYTPTDLGYLRYHITFTTVLRNLISAPV